VARLLFFFLNFILIPEAGKALWMRRLSKGISRSERLLVSLYSFFLLFESSRADASSFFPLGHG